MLSHKHYVIKVYGGVGVQIHILLTLALVGSFTPKPTAPNTHWKGGWVGPRSSLDDMQKKKFMAVQGIELQSLCRAAHSQLLYRLHYTEGGH
jgi:hypothetical protein